MVRFVGIALALAVAIGITSPSMAAQASQQVVFSGTGFGTFTVGSTTKGSPFGFWIWCEGASANPYMGVCNGAMYFYAFGITRPVDGQVTGTGEAFTMTVHSPGPTFTCQLINVPPVSSGPHNMVNVSCGAPGNVTGSGASKSAVVVITQT